MPSNSRKPFYLSDYKVPAYLVDIREPAVLNCFKDGARVQQQLGFFRVTPIAKEKTRKLARPCNFNGDSP